MKRKTKNILLIIIGLVLLALLGYIFVMTLRGPAQPGEEARQRSFFPFGQRGQQTEEEGAGDETGDETEDPAVEPVRSERPRVFKITERPVTAAHIVIKETETIVQKQDEEGLFTEEIVPSTDTLVTFADTRTGEMIRVNLDDEILEESILTVPSVPRSREGYIAGEESQYLILRYFNTSRQAIETFLGERELSELPDRVCRISITEGLARGTNESAQVEQLQVFLNYVLKKEGSTDGVFGTGTEADLKTFQRNNLLTDDGTVNSTTKNEIENQCISLEQELQENRDKPRAIPGVFLRENISSLVLSPLQNEIFYLVVTGTGSEGYVLNLSTRDERLIFTSAFSEWIASWGGTDTVLLHTAASGYVDGFVYELNTKTRAFKRVAGDQTGLTALQSPSQRNLLLGTGDENELSLSLSSQPDNTLTSLPIKTIPEKCTWAKDGVTAYCAVPAFLPSDVYPDEWYKGTVTFRDDIWRINTITKTSERIVSASEFRSEVDGVNLLLSDDGHYLILRDRDSYTLWGIDLTLPAPSN